MTCFIHFMTVSGFMFLALGTVFCERAYSQVDPTDEPVYAPSRIEARDLSIEHKDNSRPAPNIGGSYFGGVDLTDHPENTFVSLEPGYLGYVAYYPRMELYTLFPALGKLYCFDRKVDTHGRARFSASRLNAEEVPQGIKLGEKTMVLPSKYPKLPTNLDDSDRSGLWGDYVINVGTIEQEGTEKEARYKAKINVTNKMHERRSVKEKEDDKMDWRVVRIGDTVDFGKWVHYRIVNIVPSDNKGKMIRGHLCKMIGWIELEKIKPLKR